MKLITIGSSETAKIRIISDYVSSIHAEILLLDNGEIILTDKNSRNGTFLNNKRIEPNKDISIRRGDNIRIADVFLDWSKVPTIQPLNPQNVKAIYGVGSNFRNKIQVSGGAVSRFHATIKQMKNGKWFIQDHSTNGTTLNGKKLMADQDYPLKHSDEILCGGVHVENPISKPVIGKYLAILGAAAVLILLIVIGIKFVGNGINSPWNNRPENLLQASVLVYGNYSYTVEWDDDPFYQLFKTHDNIFRPIFDLYNMDGWPKEFDYGDNSSYSGTGFFISKDGKIVTNKHVVCPWANINDNKREQITQLMSKKKETIKSICIDLVSNQNVDDYIYAGTQESVMGMCLFILISNYADIGISKEDVNIYFNRFMNSGISKISGKINYIGVAYANHKYNSLDELERCTVMKYSDNDKIDLGILQLNSQETPKNIKYIHNLDRALLNPKKLSPQTETYYYIGYPGGLESMNLDNLHSGLQPTMHDLKISKKPGEYDFQMQGESIPGASGSPIVNKKGQLVGVVYGGYSNLTTSTLGVHAKYVKELADEIY